MMDAGDAIDHTAVRDPGCRNFLGLFTFRGLIAGDGHVTNPSYGTILKSRRDPPEV